MSEIETHLNHQCCVIIVTYNGAKWIDKCLTSVLNSSYSADIFIIDNGSSDNTLELVSKYEGPIRVINNKENKGFGDANNVGFKKAYPQNYDYYFLLNQDAWVDNDAIHRLIDGLEKYDDYELMSPVHMNGAGSAFDRSFKKFVNRYKTVGPHFNEQTINQYGHLIEVGFVNAAFWMLSKKCLEKVGLFHPLFYHTGEDNNYCHRVLYQSY